MSTFLKFDQEPDSRNWSLIEKRGEGATMNAVVTAAVMVTGLLIVAIWVEIRERRVAPGDGDYRSSGPPRS
jgi:hypothetical protein